MQPDLAFVLKFDGDTYNHFPELVSVPYPNQTLENHILKTTRQKLKVKLYSDRARLAL